MAFGTIRVNFPKKIEKREENDIIPKPVPQPSVKGTAVINITVAASTVLEATDYICGAFFNMVHMTRGTDITVYTREFAAIRRFTQRKTALENAVFTSDEPTARAMEEGDGLADCTVTISEAGNQELSLDINFHCVTKDAARADADAVIFLLRPGEKAPPAVADVPTFYVACGFERQNVFYEETPLPAFRAKYREELAEEREIKRAGGVYFGCVQVYGGLVLTGRKDGVPIFKTYDNCRDYTHSGNGDSEAQRQRAERPAGLQALSDDRHMLLGV